ncbi:MAG: MarR family transcriptional regulator [Anaerolineae bacterium]|nr:MarR family transcriptional regulator [Anaerolineae bacterium]
MRALLASPSSSSRNESGGLSQRLLHLNWLQHRQIARQIAAFDLTVPQFYTLITLINLGGSATMGTLSRELNQVSATMTGIVDRLVREGLVERSRSNEDRRAVLVTLTPRGYEIVEKAWAQSLNALDRMLSQMSDSERELAVKLLDALMAQLANGWHRN